MYAGNNFKQSLRTALQDRYYPGSLGRVNWRNTTNHHRHRKGKLHPFGYLGIENRKVFQEAIRRNLYFRCAHSATRAVFKPVWILDAEYTPANDDRGTDCRIRFICELYLERDSTR